LTVSGKTFLGTGWGFPIRFTGPSRAVRMVSEEEDIRESLRILFSTRPGERVMQPTYGCTLHALVFEVLNERAFSEIREAVERAILFFEPRIRLDEVSLGTEQVYEGILVLRVDYTIRTTNTRSNVVYPFYFREGTDVRL
jgi:phage baseplate assembly protein W